MTIQIKDGTGGGKLAKVDDKNRLYVRTKSLQLQHVISEEEQDAYQVSGIADLSSGTIKALHLYNSNDIKFMVLTYIRHQVVGAAGGTAFPNVSNYFSVCSGLTYASGGDVITPVNVYIGSGNISNITSYDASTTPIVTTGTTTELERWYTQANGDMNRLNKEGALIIPPRQSLTLCYTGDHTSGILSTRISYVMEND
jgi:hypothetical protein